MTDNIPTQEELTQKVNVFIKHLVDCEKSGNPFGAFGVSLDKDGNFKSFILGNGLSRHQITSAMMKTVVNSFADDARFNVVERQLMTQKWLEHLKTEVLR